MTLQMCSVTRIFDAEIHSLNGSSTQFRHAKRLHMLAERVMNRHPAQLGGVPLHFSL